MKKHKDDQPSLRTGHNLRSNVELPKDYPEYNWIVENAKQILELGYKHPVWVVPGEATYKIPID